jgi:hypothetical protein
MWLFLAKEKTAATVRQAQSKQYLHFKSFSEKIYCHSSLYIRTTLLNTHKVVKCINNAAFWLVTNVTKLYKKLQSLAITRLKLNLQNHPSTVITLS